MQTINRNETSIPDRSIDLLHTPINDIDLPVLKDALTNLRLTVSSEIHDAVSRLGKRAIDVSGTGGSGVSKFNTSTSVAFVLAAHGIDVIKFGNRSITGNSGSVDFLARLGLIREIAPDQFSNLLSKTNLLFLGAHSCYPGLASIREERRKLGRPSIFNFIGPLLNPAFPAFRFLGVSNSHMQGLLNEVLADDDSIRRAATVRSSAGLDELCPFATNSATLIDRAEGRIEISELSEFDGRSKVRNVRHQGTVLDCEASPSKNAEIFQAIIDGYDTSSQHYEGLIINSSAAFITAGAVETREAGDRLSKSLLAKGRVRLKFNQIRSALS